MGPGGIRDEAAEGGEGQSRRHDHGEVPLHMGLTAEGLKGEPLRLQREKQFGYEGHIKAVGGGDFWMQSTDGPHITAVPAYGSSYAGVQVLGRGRHEFDVRVSERREPLQQGLDKEEVEGLGGLPTRLLPVS